MNITYTRDPVSGQDFYNREDLLKELKNPENQRCNLIIGARRIGKTSLLRELERQITDYTGDIALYINLQLIPTQDYLPRLFISQCQRQAAFQSLGFYVTTFEGEKDFFKVLNALDNVLRLNDKFLFLLVDEAGKMANYELSFCDSLLGSFEMYSNIRWILTDSQPIYRVDEERGGFLREFAPYIYLPRLDRNSSIDLIRKSNLDEPVEVECALAKKIYQKTGGHPYLLQMLCLHLYEDGCLNYSDELFDNAYKACNNARVFSEAYELLKVIEKRLFLHLPDIHKVGLRQLANRWVTNEKTLKTALRELVQLGYVKQEGNVYLHADDFWNRWIDSNRSSLIRDLETGTASGLLKRTPRDLREEAKEKNEVEFLSDRIDQILFHRIDQILSQFEHTIIENKQDIVAQALENFHNVAKELGQRRKGKTTIIIEDEYDVQDILYVMLKPYLEDLKKEEYTPQHAGKSKRVDLVSEYIQTVIELKYIRDESHAKEIGDELKIDIQSYPFHPHCKTIIFYLYDAQGKIKDPKTLISDLAGKQRIKDKDIEIKVLVKLG